MSVTFSGILFDGQTLGTRAVLTNVTADRLQCQGENISLDVTLAEVRVSDRLASIPRYLYLPDGRTIETADNDTIDRLLENQNRGWIVALVHWLEVRSQVAAVATVLLVAAVAAMLRFGLPILARQTALAVPAAIESRAGKTALATFDRMLGQSQLKHDERQRAEAQLTRLLQAGRIDAKPQLVFRSMGGKYPNAFALPGGFIIVSDELVQLATNDDELAAVLAHEIGHWQRRHGLQSVLRGSAALLIVGTVTGDLSTLTTFAGSLPMLLLQRGYSREFEEEADTYAVALLRRARIDPAYLASILQKLEAVRPAGGRDFSYLSTHPATADRIRRINPDGHRPSLKVAKTSATPAGGKTAPVLKIENTPTQYEKPDTPPEPRSRPPPIYPAALKTLGVEGSVDVEFIVDRNGAVREPTVIRSTHKDFEAAALAAVAQWKFTPGRRQGRTINTRIAVQLVFNLEGEEEDSPAAPNTIRAPNDAP